MGKASKWFRGLFHLNKKPPTTKPPSLSSSSSCSQSRKPPKKKWSFIKPNKENNYTTNKPIDENSYYSGISIDPTKQAMAVAAATAAAAEVAVAAAQAAAEVVRFTSSGRTTTTTIMPTKEMFEWKDDVSSTWHVNGWSASYCILQDSAAIKIQSHFRAYLARRALRALKALVKIQALVRGHIVRKRTTDNIGRVQALLRVQARALARRSLNFGSSKIDKYTHPGPPTPEKSEHLVQEAKSMEFDRSMMLKRNGSRSDGKALTHQGRTNVHEQGHIIKHPPTEDERSDKILQVDHGIFRTPPKHRKLFHSSHLSLCSDQYSQSFTTSKESTAHQTALSPSIYDVQSLYQFKLTQDLEDGSYFTAESSPQFYSATSRDASSRRGPFTPTKSGHSGYSDHRSYMSLTESSKAKMRSLSAPRQRPQFERSSSAKRYSTLTHHIDSRLNPQRGSGLHANFSNKVYPGSGYLDRVGMPTM